MKARSLCLHTAICSHRIWKTEKSKAICCRRIWKTEKMTSCFLISTKKTMICCSLISMKRMMNYCGMSCFEMSYFEMSWNATSSWNVMNAMNATNCCDLSAA